MKKKINGSFFVSDLALLAYIALAMVAVHLAIGGNYGYFLDELYTLACSRHLSLAFVDIPPVAPALLALNTALFGDSLFAIHILPAIVSGAIVIVAGLMAKEFGGQRKAVVLTGIAAAFVPMWMAIGSLYTYDFLDQFCAVSLFYTVLRMIKRENPKLWLPIGAIAGVGMMTKPSMVFFIAALALALLLTKHRKQYLTPWPWLGALIAAVIVLPALVWQAQNGFPIAQYWVAYSGNKTVNASPAEFLLMQVVGMNIILLPLWLAGLWYLLFDREGRKFRLLGVAYLILFAVFLATGAKVYMLIPAYAMLLAAGSVSFVRFCTQGKRGITKVLVPSYLGMIVLTGVIQAPNFMPILPVDSLVKYYDTIGGLFGIKSLRFDNNEGTIQLPQYFYDRFEWDVLVKDVAEVYNGLPETERADTAIVAQNYGWAGAVDQLGAQYGLPKAMCGQLNYYFFSLGDIEKKTWIMIGETREDVAAYFGDITLAKVSLSRIRQPRELNILICRKPKFTVDQAKQGLKKFR